jgi:hypothetical protein
MNHRVIISILAGFTITAITLICCMIAYLQKYSNTMQQQYIDATQQSEQYTRLLIKQGNIELVPIGANTGLNTTDTLHIEIAQSYNKTQLSKSCKKVAIQYFNKFLNDTNRHVFLQCQLADSILLKAQYNGIKYTTSISPITKIP